MKLSKTASHAAMAVTFLARQSRTPLVRAKDVGEYLHLPTESVLKILQGLARQNLIQSQLGRRGGYYFAGNAEEVSLLEVVEAVDGPLASAVPLRPTDGPTTACVQRMQSACDRAAEAARQELSRVSIADLVRCSTPAGGVTLAQAS